MSQSALLLMLFVLVQVPALDSQSPREREEAVESMGTLGNREAVLPLVAAYRVEPRREIRRSIVAALGRIRDETAIPGLAEALRTDFDRDVRLQVIDSYLRLYIPVADETGFWNLVDRVRRTFDPEDRPVVGANVAVHTETLEALAEAIRWDFDEDVRSEAVYALASLRGLGQLPVLIDAAEGPRNREYRSVRVAAVQTLGFLASQEAGPALTRLIRDSDDSVAEEAILAVGRTGYQPAYSTLSDVFRRSDDDDMRERALESIALIREPLAVGLFQSLLDSRDRRYRELAAAGLARLDYDASDFVNRLASERDDYVKLALAFALVTSDQDSYVSVLVEDLDTRRREQAQSYLFELGRYEGKLRVMFPHLRNPKPKVRAALLEVLGRIGSEEARPYIQPLTQDGNTEVMQAAVDALRGLNP